MGNDTEHVGKVEALASADVETSEVGEMRDSGSNDVTRQPRTTLRGWLAQCP